MNGYRFTLQLVLLDFHGHTPLPGDPMADGYRSEPMGHAARVREAISSALADVDWSDPACGRVHAAESALEMCVEDEPQVRRVTVHARGTEARSMVVHLCRVLGWAAYEPATGAFLNLEERSGA